MNIGQAAEASGVSAKMIRYYERIGLVPVPGRRESGYRDYSPDDLHRLKFVRRARELGFPIPRIRALLALWSDQARSNAEVRAVAREHVAELEAQAARLEEMIATLRHLVAGCARDRRPDCPIIGELAGGSGPPAPPTRRTRRH
jgi:Cu(I)-responsive transcriptional regulator